jgi:hypothetical protein
VLVLDSSKAHITVFEPTDFGRTVHAAIELHQDGQYDKASALWDEVLKADRNYETAYRSIGKALLADRKYKAAADYFRRGNDRDGNSDAFQAYRNGVIQDHFLWFFLGVLVVVGALVAAARIARRRRAAVGDPQMQGTWIRMLFHPMETAEEMKIQRSGSLFLSLVILTGWFVLVVARFSLTGFRFNHNDVASMNLPLLFLKTIPVFVVWVMANWGVCTLMDGKGKMRDITIVSAYALVPYVASLGLQIVLSHALSLPEIFFVQAVAAVGIGWSLIVLLGGLAGIHEYSAGQTLLSVALTILGMLVVAFLVLLVTSLLKQAYAFVYSIVNEVLYRMR